MRTVISARHTVIALLLVLLATSASHLAAQDAQVAETQDLDAAVLAHESSDEIARDELGSFLADPMVQEVAAKRGIDLERLERSVETMDAAEVERLAEEAEALRQNRTTITISASTILLILLLILILG